MYFFYMWVSVTLWAQYQYSVCDFSSKLVACLWGGSSKSSWSDLKRILLWSERVYILCANFMAICPSHFDFCGNCGLMVQKEKSGCQQTHYDLNFLSRDIKNISNISQFQIHTSLVRNSNPVTSWSRWSQFENTFKMMYCYRVHNIAQSTNLSLWWTGPWGPPEVSSSSSTSLPLCCTFPPPSQGSGSLPPLQPPGFASPVQPQLPQHEGWAWRASLSTDPPVNSEKHKWVLMSQCDLLSETTHTFNLLQPLVSRAPGLGRASLQHHTPPAYTSDPPPLSEYGRHDRWTAVPDSANETHGLRALPWPQHEREEWAGREGTGRRPGGSVGPEEGMLWGWVVTVISSRGRWEDGGVGELAERGQSRVNAPG